MKKIFLTLSGLCLAIMMAAQTTSFNPGVTANGVTYALPRTVLRADVAAIKTEYVPGEFARYAERYLHLQGVGEDRTVKYSIQQIALNLEGVPDTLKAYTIKLKDKSVAPMVALSPSGIILGVNGGDKFPEAQSLVQKNVMFKVLGGKEGTRIELMVGAFP